MNMDRYPPPISSIHTRKSSVTRLVPRLTLTVVTLFVIFMAIIGIAWLVMHPRDPTFRVTSLSVSNFSTLSDLQLRGKCEVGMIVTNPNKKIQVILDRLNFVMLYHEAMLSVAVVQQPVFLEKMSNKSVKVELVVRNSAKLGHKVLLVKDWNKGVVNFDVKMNARVRFEAGIWPSRDKMLDVYCGDLDVEFHSPKDTGKERDCHLVT